MKHSDDLEDTSVDKLDFNPEGLHHTRVNDEDN